MKIKKMLITLLIIFMSPVLVFGMWLRQNSGTSLSLNGIFFTDSLYGLAVGGNNNSGIILRTTDGGTNWLTAYTDTQSVFYGVWFIDRQTGWVVGGRDNYVVIDSTCQKILKTTDGGINWQRQWNRNRNTNWRNLYGVCFIGNTGWATVTGWADSVGYIILTTDGGTTWTNQRIPYPASYPLDIHFVDLSRGFCSGGENWAYPFDNTDGTIWASNDGGTTWTVTHRWRPGTAAMGLFSNIWMVNCQRGFSAGGAGGVIVREPGRVVSNSNCGSTWSLRNPSPLRPFGGVYFPDTSLGWIGANGTGILITTDGGRTWQDDNAGYTGWIGDIHGLNRRNAWAVGEGGTILRYAPATGIEESQIANLEFRIAKLKIKPNPFSSFATIPGHEKRQFSVYDISGKLVGIYKGERIGEDLRAGVYFVRAEEQKSGRLMRIVKVR